MAIFAPNPSIHASGWTPRAAACTDTWSNALFARDRARTEARMIDALQTTLDADAERRHNPKTARVRERRRAGLRALLTKHRCDRGIFARACVVEAWRCFEQAAAHALETELRAGFFAELELALRQARLPPLDRGHAAWRKLEAVRTRYEHYAHRECEVEELLATERDADEAIACVRAGVAELYRELARELPSWISADAPVSAASASAGACLPCDAVEDDGSYDEPDDGLRVGGLLERRIIPPRAQNELSEGPGR